MNVKDLVNAINPFTKPDRLSKNIEHERHVLYQAIEQAVESTHQTEEEKTTRMEELFKVKTGTWKVPFVVEPDDRDKKVNAG